jgi:hypothetical protein
MCAPPPSTHPLQLRSSFLPLMLQSHSLRNPIFEVNPRTIQKASVKDRLTELRRLHLVGEGEGQAAGDEE